ncbi:UDP-GlcNAc:undecaprenyl-phosphate GlcNAc-1-phosphate transferase [Caldicoprobacter guelmensis]|uniref:glycosyltransferase family 4 protein n=1 Tax=Caldicoprobacter guelmensis TaxID=1170224 RepID=UPI0019569C48|nr:MraY family glycosyltransferase [Caldicoprobacter guelmensis]MBM7581186.1 UDP-GlcNAc:undecaprenyl-phosphate GlcNAc-1-phosphate transferase [Caldicoprobacter guelmensis]
MKNLGAFVIAFLISLLGMPLVIKFANKNGIVDKPNGRKIHKKPVPLLGGAAIFIGFIIPFVMFSNIDFKVVSIVVASVILVVVGMFDDIYDIKAKKKLAVQILCSVLVVVAGIRVNISEYITDNVYLAFLIDGLISICWIIGIINAVNLIDGLDGLAGGVSFIASIAFIIILGREGSDYIGYIIALSLAGAIIGFLLYNFYPAKVFMGDMGSTFIGLLLAVLSIIALDIPENPASMVAPIIILAVPIFDTGLAILRRIAQRQPLFSADKNHLHHRLIAKGFSQRQAVFIIYSLAVLAALVGVIVDVKRWFYFGVVVVGLLVVLGIVISFGGLVRIEKFVEKMYKEMASTTERHTFNR